MRGRHGAVAVDALEHGVRVADGDAPHRGSICRNSALEILSSILCEGAEARAAAQRIGRRPEARSS